MKSVDNRCTLLISMQKKAAFNHEIHELHENFPILSFVYSVSFVVLYPQHDPEVWRHQLQNPEH